MDELTNEAWNKRREELQDEVRKAVHELAKHVGTNAMRLPASPEHPFLVVAGDEASVRSLVEPGPAQGEAVAWQAMDLDGPGAATESPDLRDDWIREGIVVRPLYTHPAPAQEPTAAQEGAPGAQAMDTPEDWGHKDCEICNAARAAGRYPAVHNEG